MAAQQTPEDSLVMQPFAVPPSEPERADAVWKAGKYTFRADFDSGNLATVRQGPTPSEFHLWTRRDCQDSEHERGTRSWFYFGISGHQVGDFVVLTIMNLNKQGRLFSQDYRPWVCCQSMGEWQQLSNKVSYKREGDDFQLRFSHKFETTDEMFFAFAIPYSYRETQAMLDRVSRAMAHCTHIPAPVNVSHGGSTSSRLSSTGAPVDDAHSTAESEAGGLRAAHGGRPMRRSRQHVANSDSSDSRIYFNRVLLARSIEGRHIDLLTITDCHGASDETEPLPPAAAMSAAMQASGSGCWNTDADQQSPESTDSTHEQPIDITKPPVRFPGKKVFFVSARVHPGETPATHMFNGLLAFLLRTDDARAAALRRHFVFKLVPIVNPDGVFHGHYRTDTLGQNLNRYYLGNPNRDLQPSVWAIKRQLMHYATSGLLEFYLDLHAHANKKGVFIYGNALEGEQALSSLLYAKLIALNSPVFDFMHCNYTEKNMSRADKDGISKEGAARVALFKETRLTHLYTIEANYNTARVMNVVGAVSGDHGGRATPPSGRRFPPKFTASVLHQVGRAFAIAALDLYSLNPWTRLPSSEHRSLEANIAWLTSVLRASPETRAQNLPAMSDASVDTLRALPNCVTLESLGLVKQQQPPQQSQHTTASHTAQSAGHTQQQHNTASVTSHTTGNPTGLNSTGVSVATTNSGMSYQHGVSGGSNVSKRGARVSAGVAEGGSSSNGHSSASHGDRFHDDRDRVSPSYASSSSTALQHGSGQGGRRYLPSLPTSTTPPPTMQTLLPAASGIPTHPGAPQTHSMFPARGLKRSSSLPSRSGAHPPTTPTTHATTPTNTANISARLARLAKIPSGIPRPPGMAPAAQHQHGGAPDKQQPGANQGRNAECVSRGSDGSSGSLTHSESGEGAGVGRVSGSRASVEGGGGGEGRVITGMWPARPNRIRSGRFAGAPCADVVPLTELRIKLAEPTGTTKGATSTDTAAADMTRGHKHESSSNTAVLTLPGAAMAHDTSATALVMATAQWQQTQPSSAAAAAAAAATAATATSPLPAVPPHLPSSAVTPRFYRRLLASLEHASNLASTMGLEMVNSASSTVPPATRHAAGANHHGAPRPLRSSVSLPSGPTELVSAVEPVVTNMKVVGKLPAFKPGRRRSALVGGF